MLRRKLDPELHGSAGFTSVRRMAALGLAVGFFGVGFHLLTQARFDDRIMPGVVVAGQNLGGLTRAQARTVLDKDVAGYRLKLKIAEENYVLTAPQLGVTFDTEMTVASAYRQGRGAWLVPMHYEPMELSYRLDRAQLNRFTESVVQKIGTVPVDAGVTVQNGAIKTVAEKSGWTIDRVGLQRLIENDVQSPGRVALNIQPREQLADIQVRALAPTLAEAKQLMAVPVVLTYADRTFTPTSSQIGQWLAFQKQSDGTGFKLVAQIDTAKLKGYVQTVANSIDVAPVNKKVTVENGVSKTTQEGVEGLAIDQDPVTVALGAAIAKQAPLNFTITAHPVAFKTVSTTLVTLDLGRYIEINLSSQHLWVWQDHAVIFDSPITSGATGAGFPTVTGLFAINYKTTNTHLVGYQYGPRYNYDVAVKYWMPFYEGYGLHDASWRNGNFGGQDYYYGGSHGCVNMPDATAAFVYNWATVGTPVWLHQ